MISRVNISVPEELKRQMNKYDINWSLIATVAFTKHLNKLKNKVSFTTEERLDRIETVLGLK